VERRNLKNDEGEGRRSCGGAMEESLIRVRIDDAGAGAGSQCRMTLNGWGGGCNGELGEGK
jgi:hypothetical protein